MTALTPPFAADASLVSVRRFEKGSHTPEEGEAPLAPLKIIRPSAWYGRAIPPREWIVRDWIPVGTVTGLYGDGGLGKSLLAQQLQTACAKGAYWIGHAAEPVKSIGFYCEDDEDELLRRQFALNAALDCDRADLANIELISRVNEDNLLMTFSKSGRGELTRLHGQLLERALDFDARLVVVDTAADTFGGNENDRGQVRQFVARCLGSIASGIKGAVLLCAHPSRSGIANGTGDGGSTAWSNSMRSRLSLLMPGAEDGAPPSNDERVLQRKKANYATRNDEIPITWSAGAFVFNRPSAPAFRPCVEDVFLDLLDVLPGQGRSVSHNKMAGNFAPRVFSKHPERQGYKARDFERAMEALFSGKKIRVAEDGPPSKRRHWIVRQ